jgi:hypothetical protein
VADVSQLKFRRITITGARWGLLVVFVSGTLVGLVAGSTPGRQELFFVTVIVYVAVGFVVTEHQPKNPIGWLFLLVGALTGLAAVADGGMTAALARDNPAVWYGRWGAWLNAWFWFPLFASATLFTIQLFPDGPLSRRWRPLLWGSVAVTALVTVGVSTQGVIPVGESWGTPERPCAPPNTVYDGTCGRWVDNPLGAPASWTDTGSVGQAVGVGLILVLTACLGLAVLSAVLRFRKSNGDARLQMRWFAWAATVLMLWLLFSAVTAKSDANGLDPWWAEVGFAVATALIPLACGVAILRYRLYDIDRLISRTFAYAIVTGLLVAAFATIVVSASRLLNTNAPWVVAVATLAAAAMARPALNRVQGIVDRRFNRAHYDAQNTVDAFGRHLRQETHPERVEVALLNAVADALQPTTVALSVVKRP